MAEAAPKKRAVRFGVFEVDLDAGELHKSGLKLKIQEQPFQVLKLLLERPGEIVTREELITELWPDGTFVEFDRSLNIAVNKIREALGDSASSPRFVETVPRRGYRFLAPVEVVGGPPSPPAAAERRTRLYIAAAVVTTILTTSVLTWLVVGRSATEVTNTQVEAEMSLVPFTTYPGREDNPDFSPDGTQVAFDGNVEDEHNTDIYVRMTGSSGLLRLTTDPAWDETPKWSPDGRSIAFLRTRSAVEPADLMLIPAIGGPERKIAEIGPHGWTTPPPFFDWAPDGTHLAVVDRAAADDPLSLHLISTTGNERRQLTSPLTGGTSSTST